LAISNGIVVPPFSPALLVNGKLIGAGVPVQLYDSV